MRAFDEVPPALGAEAALGLVEGVAIVRSDDEGGRRDAVYVWYRWAQDVCAGSGSFECTIKSRQLLAVVARLVRRLLIRVTGRHAAYLPRKSRGLESA